MTGFEAISGTDLLEPKTDRWPSKLIYVPFTLDFPTSATHTKVFNT